MEKAMGLLKEHFSGDPLAAMKLDAGTFEDLIVLEPEADKDITVAMIEELVSLFKQKPFASTSRACLISRGERMNESAQNKLLKLLEEPAVGDVVFIMAENAQRLLPTVRSRCMRVWLGYPAQTAGPLTEDVRALTASLVYGKGTLAEAWKILSSYEGSREDAAGFLAAFQLFMRNVSVARLAPELPGYAAQDAEWLRASAAKVIQKHADRMRRGVALAEKAQKDIERGDRVRYALREMALALRTGRTI